MSCNNATDYAAKERAFWKAEEQSWNEQMTQLRADLDTVTAERDYSRSNHAACIEGTTAKWSQLLDAERAAHAATRKALEEMQQARAGATAAYESTRAELVVQRSDDEQPQTYAVEIAHLRQVLSAHGLHIVSEAERKVLEACAAFPTEALTGDLYPSRDNRNELSDISLRWSEAELARRSGA